MARVLVGVKRVIDYAVKVSETLKVTQQSAENCLSGVICQPWTLILLDYIMHINVIFAA